MIAPGLGVEPTLQDERGGDLVDDISTLFPGNVGFDQSPFGGNGRQTLVMVNDGKVRNASQRFSERSSRCGSRTLRAVHVQGQTHDPPIDRALFCETYECFKVGFEVLSSKDRYRLSGEAQLVGNGETNRFGSHIKSHCTHWFDPTSEVFARRAFAFEEVSDAPRLGRT
jgi:hypothetical protein